MYGPGIIIPNSLSKGVGWPWIDSENYPKQEWVYPLPKISIVIPTLNQSAFIEKAIRSVLLQHYPKVELLVMDGGSNDGTVDVLNHYMAHLSHWQSRPDRGQSDAINQGMKHATGDLVAWLNSDDYYLAGAFWRIAQVWTPSSKQQWIVGVTEFRNERDILQYAWAPKPASGLGEALSCGAGVPQTSGFWGIDLWHQVGGVDISLHYSMDEDLFMKFYLAGTRPHCIDATLATMVIHGASKSGSLESKFSLDFSSIVKRYRNCVPKADLNEWKWGVGSMAERYGIYAWNFLADGNPQAANEFIRSGLRLSLSKTLWGITRAGGVSIKQWLKYVVKKLADKDVLP